MALRKLRTVSAMVLAFQFFYDSRSRTWRPLDGRAYCYLALFHTFLYKDQKCEKIHQLGARWEWGEQPCIWTQGFVWQASALPVELPFTDKELVLDQPLGLIKEIHFIVSDWWLPARTEECQILSVPIKSAYCCLQCSAFQCFKLLWLFGLSALILCTQLPQPPLRIWSQRLVYISSANELYP